MSTDTPLQPTNAWEAVNVSLTAFPVDPQAGLNANWWSELTGSNELDSSRRKLERTDDGEYHGHGLKLQIDPLRTSWTFGPILTGDVNAIGRVPTLGEFVAARDDFCEVMGRWLQSYCPPVYRIAFVARLFLLQESRESAYLALNRFLTPWVTLDPDSSDFQYHINRRRTSRVLEVPINRLCIWTALRYQVDARVNNGESRRISDSFGCHLQLDVNTPAENTTPLPHDQLLPVFLELAEMATEIAEKGDIR